MIWLTTIELFLSWTLFALFLLAASIYYLVHNYKPNFMIRATLFLLIALTFQFFISSILWTIAATGSDLIYDLQYFTLIPKLLLIASLICYIRLSVRAKEDVTDIKNCFE